MIATAAICGAIAGIGGLIILRALKPVPPSLRAVLDAIANDEPPPVVLTQSSDLIDRVGRPLVPLVESFGLPMTRLRKDLAVTGRSFERHLAEKAAMAIFGFVLMPMGATVMTLGGVPIPWAMPLWLAVASGIAFFFVPDFGVHSEAERRRRSFRHGLGAFLDLVVIGLAGGGGVEGALDGASKIGSGWAFVHIRAALDDAQLRGESPWRALSRLGESLEINELIELAASVGLAGTEGAKVRASLGAKAVSLRQHQLSEAESAAQSASEQMSIPVVLLFAGFLVFIGYPAISQVINGL